MCLGYTVADVEAQARIAVHARSHGFDGACTALLLSGQTASFACEVDGRSCYMLSWVEDTPADKVAAAGSVPAESVLEAVGRGLAQLHCVPVSDEAGLRSLDEGGACDVHLHLSDQLLTAFRESEHSRGHAFLPFYETQLAALKQVRRSTAMPRAARPPHVVCPSPRVRP